MSIVSSIRSFFSSPQNVVAEDEVRVSYESEMSSFLQAIASPYEINDDDDPMMRDHFRDAGDLWGHQNSEFRRDAEEKADLETRNSGHLHGARKIYANDIMGKCGATAQAIASPAFPFTEDTRDEYQRKLQRWFADIRFTRQIKTMLKQVPSRGAGLGIFHPVTGATERANFPNPIKIGFMERDTRRLDDDTSIIKVDPEAAEKSPYKDGIKYDAYGRPLEYRLRKGNVSPAHDIVPKPSTYDYVPASHVVHLFDHDYSEQRQGFSQYASVLHPAVMARKAAEAIVKAMQKLACMWVYLEQPNLPPKKQSEEKLDVDGKKCGKNVTQIKGTKPGREIPLSPDKLKVLGGGLKPHTIKPEHPTANTESFLSSLWAWVGRAICIPQFKITGDYSKANFTSMRMGLQDWGQTIFDMQATLELEAYEKAHKLWFESAVRTPGYFSDALMDVVSRASTGEPIYPPIPEVCWHWKQREAVSPLVEARANQISLSTGTKTLADLVTDGDIETKWKCEAAQFGITLDALRRIKLAAIHGLTPDQLDQLLAEDALVEQTSEDGATELADATP